MRMPNPDRYNPDPEYLRALLAIIGRQNKEVSDRFKIHPSQLRFYLVRADLKSHRPAPYLFQYAIECWAWMVNEKRAREVIEAHDQVSQQGLANLTDDR